MTDDPDPVLPERLNRALSGLPPVTREIFLAHRLGELPYDTIAERTGLTALEVEGHIVKALLYLDWQLNGPRALRRGRLFAWLRRRMARGERKGG